MSPGLKGLVIILFDTEMYIFRWKNTINFISLAFLSPNYVQTIDISIKNKTVNYSLYLNPFFHDSSVWRKIASFLEKICLKNEMESCSERILKLSKQIENLICNLFNLVHFLYERGFERRKISTYFWDDLTSLLFDANLKEFHNELEIKTSAKCIKWKLKISPTNHFKRHGGDVNSGNHNLSRKM